MKEIFFKGAVIAALTTGLCATSSLAAARSVALNKSIETLEPMKGIVFWPDQAKSQKDLQKSISLEFSYCLPCAVVTGEYGGKISYDWSSFEKLLEDIKSRGHQAIVRFRIEYPNETIKNAPNCTENVKGATAVPNYFVTNSNYLETFSENPGGDGPTFYADWSSTALQWFYKQFYADFAAKYDKDPRIAFVQAGFGHWAEYHIYGTKLKLGSNFPSKDYQRDFLTHLDTLFKETPWSISIDAADDEYTPIARNKTLLALNFGLFDDSFMHEKHDISQGEGDNEKNWQTMGKDRWKTSPAGGEISYYEDKDQKEFLNPAGLYGVTWEDAAAKYHMTYVIGNDAPEGKYATRSRVYEASSNAGYKFEVTGFAVNKVSAAIRVKNVGIAPLYHNAYVTIKGIRSEKSLKGLLPGEEATYTISGISIADSETPELTITSNKLLQNATIPYNASLNGSAAVIEGLVDENGTTSIAGARWNKGAASKVHENRAKNSQIVDLKGRTINNAEAQNFTGTVRKAYYKVNGK
ncbi:DUF4832 domain-containing protein [Fibrobacter sp. UWB12]|uniref:DUF4832 domain-containing protein n=1 Tax=Fibrobacter sp. UWB12 TaxID=1896203 RepID=UPI0009168507|nr:DUF4832 domain-containing protein [Fibrobacter sp. UWB12]SHK67102.1 protein of unknown function [Fibrobacter sp. UWB12]